MIKNLFSMLVILLFFTPISAKDAKSNPEDPQITEVIEVIGNVNQNRTVQSVSIIDKKKMKKFRLNNLKSFISTAPGVLTLSTGKFGQTS